LKDKNTSKTDFAIKSGKTEAIDGVQTLILSLCGRITNFARADFCLPAALI